MKLTIHKGQIFSMDFMIAMLVFLFMLAVTLSYSGEISNRIALIEKDSARFTYAQHAANAVMFSSGYPADWENLSDLTTVTSFGLAENRNIISPAKVQRMADLNQSFYAGIKDLLGLSKYDLKIEIIKLDTGVKLKEFGTNPGSEDIVTSINRFGDYNGVTVNVRVKVFEQ